jgi:hypothetical protein
MIRFRGFSSINRTALTPVPTTPTTPTLLRHIPFPTLLRFSSANTSDQTCIPLRLRPSAVQVAQRGQSRIILSPHPALVATNTRCSMLPPLSLDTSAQPRYLRCPSIPIMKISSPSLRWYQAPVPLHTKFSATIPTIPVR